MSKGPNTAKVARRAAAPRDEQMKLVEALLESIESDGGDVAIKAGMTKAQRKLALEQKAKQALEQQVAQVRERRQLTQEQLQANFAEAQFRQQQMIAASVYVNVPKALEKTTWEEVAPNRYIRFGQFDGSLEQVNFLMDLFSRELSEPYSSYTYQYFIQGWPDLAVISFGYEGAAAPDSSVAGTMVGGIVSKVARKGPGHPLRAYVAMLAVEKSFRGSKIGSRLVAESVGLMRAKDCDYVYLETPIGNERAMKLYTDLGFAKVKMLPRYYMDGSDAIRLKLWLKAPFQEA